MPRLTLSWVDWINCLAQHCAHGRARCGPVRMTCRSGARARSAIQTRTGARGGVEGGSVGDLIRTTSARPRRAELPRGGSGWRIRTHVQCNPSLVFKSSKYFIHFRCLRAISFRAQFFPSPCNVLFSPRHQDDAETFFCANYLCRESGIALLTRMRRISIATFSYQPCTQDIKVALFLANTTQYDFLLHCIGGKVMLNIETR